MVKKNYDWDNGAELEEHTKKKHTILREYFRQYLLTRCQLPRREKFRIAIIDGFSGAGLYKCGTHGSPLIFVTTLAKTANEINLNRLSQCVKPIQIECLLIVNDLDKSAIEKLRKNIAPLLIEATGSNQNLHIETEFLNAAFEEVYPQIKIRLQAAKCSNMLFNLDQCGYSHVTSSIVKNIIGSWRSAEVILTFMIGSMLAYLSPEKDVKGVPLDSEMKIKIDALLDDGDNFLSKKQWKAPWCMVRVQRVEREGSTL